NIGVEEFSQQLRQELGHVAGATISVFTNDFAGGRKQVQLQLRGPDLASLTTAAERVKAVVQTVPGAVDVDLSTRGQKPELEVELNRGVAGSLGVSVGQVAQSMRPAFAGLHATDWEDPSGKTRDVEVRLDPTARQRAADLAQLPLTVLGPNGVPAMMPL